MSPSTKVRSDKISSSDKLVIVLAFYPLDKIQVHTNTVICIMVGQYYPAIMVVCQINCQTQILKRETVSVFVTVLYLVKFIYSEKATKFCEVSTLLFVLSSASQN